MTKKEINLSETRHFLQQLLPQAGQILIEYFESGEFSKQEKEGVDFTTEADKAVDKLLREQIAARLPGHTFLTEETAPEKWEKFKNADNLWLIDPLDGTINFSRGHPNFAISIGLSQKGEVTLGVIYVPIRREMYWAQKDEESAFLDGQRISVSETKESREVVVACDWAWGLERRKEVVRCLGKICGHVRQIKSMGSAAADLAALAQGRIDAYLHAGLKPWDTAAAEIIVKKAGGVITDLKGEKWNPFIDNILAGNKTIHSRILHLISS